MPARIMSSFFPMRPTERRFLTSLVVFSAISFLPMWREVYIAGMSLFGWWMSALMVVSPLGALLIFFFERRRNRQAPEDPS